MHHLNYKGNDAHHKGATSSQDQSSDKCCKGCAQKGCITCVLGVRELGRGGCRSLGQRHNKARTCSAPRTLIARCSATLHKLRGVFEEIYKVINHVRLKKTPAVREREKQRGSVCKAAYNFARRAVSCGTLTFQGYAPVAAPDSGKSRYQTHRMQKTFPLVLLGDVSLLPANTEVIVFFFFFFIFFFFLRKESALTKSSSKTSPCFFFAFFAPKMSAKKNLATMSLKEQKKYIEDARLELQTLRVAQVTGGAASKVGKIKLVRKNIARGLTAINQKAKSSYRKQINKAVEKDGAAKCSIPKELRAKKTRAIRRALTPKEVRGGASFLGGGDGLLLLLVSPRPSLPPLANPQFVW